MTTTDQIILVTGATGQQGGATVRHLLAGGWRVRALVRDPASPAAYQLAADGAELVRGDLDDRASLDAATRGAYGVFSVQPASSAPHLPDDEVGRGVRVADAAHAAGVRHLVYTSVGGADRGTSISHWNTKWEIEQHIRTLGLPATILRPVMFMENHASPGYGVTSDAALIRMIGPGTRVQLIAVSDIGAFAALAFADPDRYLGSVIELAGDELTREQLIAAISGATGRTLAAEPIPRETLVQLGIDPDNVRGADSFGRWQADIPALRALHPALMNFDTWLAREGRAKFEKLFAEADR